MKNKAILAISVTSALMFSGCATLFGGGGKQTIAINVDGEKRIKGTMRYVDEPASMQHFTAPATLNVERRKSDIILASEDEEFHEVTVKSSVNGWFLANILGAPGGTILSSTTDAASGSMWKYDDTVNLTAK